MARPKGSKNKTYADLKIQANQPAYQEPTAFAEIKEKKDMPQDEVDVQEKKRKISDENDHKGPNHPLCHNCGHREDMHHDWTYFKIPVEMKDQNGRVTTEYKTTKEIKWDGDKRCQHACKCEAFE